MTRAITDCYADPVDEVWLDAARKLGIALDLDDRIAQRVFRELCLALVAGEGSLDRPSWGTSSRDERNLLREHACHRLQAALADRHGLRELMAVTTEHRPYWDALPDDPLTASDDPAVELARAAFVRSRKQPWREPLNDALAATAAIAHEARMHSPKDSPWASTLPQHPLGFALHRNPARSCADCAWNALAGPGKRVPRCRQTRTGPDSIPQRVDSNGRACERWEPRLDAEACGRCGACCREAFDLVHVRPRERVLRLHRELVREGNYGLSLPRPNGRCVALEGGQSPGSPYRCRIYEDRPRACADFELAGDACLDARRRVGLSR